MTLLTCNDVSPGEILYVLPGTTAGIDNITYFKKYIQFWDESKPLEVVSVDRGYCWLNVRLYGSAGTAIAAYPTRMTKSSFLSRAARIIEANA